MSTHATWPHIFVVTVIDSSRKHTEEIELKSEFNHHSLYVYNIIQDISL